jgi:tRNA(Glu) U13 pseudouridine synthase TruD
MKTLNNKLQTHSNKQGTRVRIPWITGYNSYAWNEICASAIEKFGLPGDRYYTHATEEYMDFYFTDERDAILFQLLL